MTAGVQMRSVGVGGVYKRSGVEVAVVVADKVGDGDLSFSLRHG